MNLGLEVGRLLDHIDVLRRPSDLDLLIFFARHPRSLLSSDQIAAFLGHAVKDVAASLERLLDAGFVTRTPNPRHVARMYLLTGSPPGGGWLPELKRIASTREGRLAILVELRRRSSNALEGSTPRGDASAAAGSTPLRFLQGRSAVDAASRSGGARSAAGLDERPTTHRAGGA